MLAASWLALLITTPMLPTLLAAALYAAGSLICHQQPERSFYVDGAQLPVCGRCLGVYAGAAFGLALSFVPATVPHLAPRTLLIVGLVPTIVTLGLEWTGIADPGNIVRGAAGVPIGLAAAFVLGPRLR